MNIKRAPERLGTRQDRCEPRFVEEQSIRGSIDGGPAKTEMFHAPFQFVRRRRRFFHRQVGECRETIGMSFYRNSKSIDLLYNNVP